jgi:putative transposase
LNTELNARKRVEFPWLCELPWRVTNAALEDLGCAFTNFFRRCKQRTHNKGYPRFKSKKRVTPSFGIEGRALVFNGPRVRVPKLGWLRLCAALRFPGKVLVARFSERAGHWYGS